jgi:hypothetical protein
MKTAICPNAVVIRELNEQFQEGTFRPEMLLQAVLAGFIAGSILFWLVG